MAACVLLLTASDPYLEQLLVDDVANKLYMGFPPLHFVVFCTISSHLILPISMYAWPLRDRRVVDDRAIHVLVCRCVSVVGRLCLRLKMNARQFHFRSACWRITYGGFGEKRSS